MTICKIYTLKDLESTGLKVFDSCRYAGNEVETGEIYLKEEVINQWDFTDYSNCYMFFEDGIPVVVNVCKNDKANNVMCKHLNKDLSNANGDEL